MAYLAGIMAGAGVPLFIRTKGDLPPVSQQTFRARRHPSLSPSLSLPALLPNDSLPQWGTHVCQQFEGLSPQLHQWRSRCCLEDFLRQVDPSLLQLRVYDIWSVYGRSMPLFQTITAYSVQNILNGRVVNLLVHMIYNSWCTPTNMYPCSSPPPHTHTHTHTVSL